MATTPIPSVTPPAAVHVNVDASKLVRASFKSPTADSQPCNWEVTPIGPAGENNVTCKNTVSGSTFEGTIAEFSAALKGL